MSTLARALALGALLGLVAQFPLACGSSKPCGADTCAGCCDSSGACVAGNTKGACGSAGATCVACPGDQTCAAGFCSGSAGGGTGGGTGGGGGGGGDSGGGGAGGNGGGGGAGGGGSMSAADMFLADLTTLYCSRSIACGFTASNSAADCAALLRLSFGETSYSVSTGASGFEPQAAGACLSRMTAASCAELGRELNICFDAFSPRTMTGGACYTGDECVQATDGCDGPLYCGRTCRTQGTRDAPCRAGGFCNYGLYCQASSNTCQPTVPPGSPCPTSTMCDGNGVCTSGMCQALPTAGQACRSATPRCADNAFCSGMLCQLRQAVGGACGNQPDACQVGLVCVGGQCVARQGVDGACTTTAECQDGLVCDAVLRRCGALEYDLPRGATCTRSTRFCRVDSQVCSGQTTGADGGATSSGACRDSLPGDPCVANTDCNAGRFCAGAGAAAARSCQDAGVGSSCATAANCRPSEDCVQSICQPRVATGSRCSTSGPGCLDPAAVCVLPPNVDGGAASSCRLLGAPGAACRSGTASCQFPYVCLDGGCVEAGHQGQPCLPFWGCLDGVCLQRDGGLGNDSTAQCAAPRADGQPCLVAVNCASGTCDPRSGVCISACH